jgi:hypothetical protein
MTRQTIDDDEPRRARIPDIALPPLAGGASVPLRMRRMGTVLVLLGAVPRPGDAAWLASLVEVEPSLREWDGRVVVVVQPGAAVPELLGMEHVIPTVVDDAGRVARAAGVSAPALVVTDQWGEVHVAVEAHGAPWMPPSELERWVRFLAVRCAG